VCTVTVEEGEPKKRSLDANGLMHVWYKQISEYTTHSKKEVEAYCKCYFGMPILRFDIKNKDEEEIADYINWMMKECGYDERPEPQQRKIAFGMPCTRLMSPRQHTAFLEQLQMHYAPGLVLESK
jgi:hypothetical protein